MKTSKEKEPPACTLAQCGLLHRMWDIWYFCEKWGMTREETNELLEWFKIFHAKQVRKARKYNKNQELLRKEIM